MGLHEPKHYSIVTFIIFGARGECTWAARTHLTNGGNDLVFLIWKRSLSFAGIIVHLCIKNKMISYAIYYITIYNFILLAYRYLREVFIQKHITKYISYMLKYKPVVSLYLLVYSLVCIDTSNTPLFLVDILSFMFYFVEVIF